MIIKSLSLKPFAGIADKKVEFSSGLNVILGPNEAGKSSLLNALKTVLFVDTDLTCSRYEKEIRDYMPAHGGDIIRINLNFEVGDKECWLEKEWKMGGKGGSCLLKLGDGVEYTNDNKVSGLIRECLPAQEGTIKNILLTWQSSLGQTRNIFNDEGKDGKDGRGVRTDLGNILRDSIMETDGISVDKLKERLDFEYKDYFSHWDIDRERPENDRGINKPYVKEVGNILRAYYGKEEKYRDYAAAIEIEGEIDRLNELIKEKEVKLKVIEEDLNKYQPIRSKIYERQQIESDKTKLEYEVEKKIEINDDWTIKDNWLSNNAYLEIDSLKNNKKEYEEQRELAREYEKRKELEQRFKKLKGFEDKLKEVEDKLSQISPITREVLDILQNKNMKIKEIGQQIKASKLKIIFQAKKSLDFVTEDIDGNREDYSLEKNKKLEKTFQGKLTIEHKDWRLDLQAGEEEIDQFISQKEELKNDLEEILVSLKVENVEQAQSVNREYEKYKNEIASYQIAFQEELGNDDYRELQKIISSLEKEELPSISDVDEIIKNIAHIEMDLREAEKKKQNHEEQIEKWKKEYRSKKELITMIGKCQYTISQLDENLKTLPELPEGFEGYQKFFEYVDSLSGNREIINEKIYELRNEKADKEREKPEQSAEELRVVVEDAERNFERVYQEGKAVALIKDKMDTLLKEIEENPYQDFQKKFKKYFLNMSGGSFVGIEMEGDFPQKMVKPGGAELSYELLSFGTKDTFALALRLTMADYFLEGKDGFLVLDDPLVEMDRERQTLAAEQINEFSKTKQVIFLTCHEHTANLLKGNHINL